MALQHRGQTFSGISTTMCNQRIFSHKGVGLVSKVLNQKKLKAFPGNVGIGHVSYDLPKMDTIDDTQPYHFKSEFIWQN